MLDNSEGNHDLPRIKAERISDIYVNIDIYIHIDTDVAIDADTDTGTGNDADVTVSLSTKERDGQPLCTTLLALLRFLTQSCMSPHYTTPPDIILIFITTLSIE